MSCFVVSDYHVSALVAWAVRHRAVVGISPDALAHMLASANRAAYAERYEGDPVEPFEGFDRSVDPSHLAPVAIVKACDCLDYQCSDWSSWSDIGSEPAAHLAAIRAAALALALAAHCIIPGPNAGGLEYGRELPGYDAAAWTLDAPAPTCPHCARDLETDAELATGECTSDDCSRLDVPDPDKVDRLAAVLADMSETEADAIRAALAATRCAA